MRVSRRLPQERSRKGAVLICALVCLLLATLMAGVLLQRTSAERERVRTAQSRLQAAWLAESALERASAALAASPGYKGEIWHPTAADIGGADGGRVAITVERVAGQAAARRVKAQADYPADATLRARQTREVLIEINSVPPGERP